MNLSLSFSASVVLFIVGAALLLGGYLLREKIKPYFAAAMVLGGMLICMLSFNLGMIFYMSSLNG